MKKQIWQKRTFKQVLGVMTALLMLVMAAVPAFGDESLSQSGEGNPAELEIGDEGAAAEADIFSTEPVPETEPSVTEPKYWEGGGGISHHMTAVAKRVWIRRLNRRMTRMRIRRLTMSS